MMETKLTFDALRERWKHLDPSPVDIGTVDMIVRRPDIDQREELQAAQFNEMEGLEGDNWLTRGSTSTADSSRHYQGQRPYLKAVAIAILYWRNGFCCPTRLI